MWTNRRFVREELGAEFVEWALVAALFALTSSAGFSGVSNAIEVSLTRVGAGFDVASAPPNFGTTPASLPALAPTISGGGAPRLATSSRAAAVGIGASGTSAGPSAAVAQVSSADPAAPVPTSGSLGSRVVGAVARAIGGLSASNGGAVKAQSDLADKDSKTKDAITRNIKG